MTSRRYNKDNDLNDDEIQIEIEAGNDIDGFLRDVAGKGDSVLLSNKTSRQVPGADRVCGTISGFNLGRIVEYIQNPLHRQASYNIIVNRTQKERDEKQAARDEEESYRKSKDVKDDKRWKNQHWWNVGLGCVGLVLSAATIMVAIVAVIIPFITNH